MDELQYRKEELVERLFGLSQELLLAMAGGVTPEEVIELDKRCATILLEISLYSPERLN